MEGDRGWEGMCRGIGDGRGMWRGDRGWEENVEGG